MAGMDLFEAAQYHARRARELRRIATGRVAAVRRVLHGHARTHEAMVRSYASIVVIEACDARAVALCEARCAALEGREL